MLGVQLLQFVHTFYGSVCSSVAMVSPSLHQGMDRCVPVARRKPVGASPRLLSRTSEAVPASSPGASAAPVGALSGEAAPGAWASYAQSAGPGPDPPG